MSRTGCCYDMVEISQKAADDIQSHAFRFWSTLTSSTSPAIRIASGNCDRAHPLRNPDEAVLLVSNQVQSTKKQVGNPTCNLSTHVRPVSSEVT